MTERSDLAGRLRAYLDDMSTTTGGTGMSERLAAIAATTREGGPRRRTRLIGAGAGLVTAAGLAGMLVLALAHRGGGGPNVVAPGAAPGGTSIATPVVRPSTPPRTSSVTLPPASEPSFRPTSAPKVPVTGASPWDLMVAIDETGLRPGQKVTYKVETLFAGNTGCTNGSGPPSSTGTNSGNPSDTVTLTADATGEARGTLTITAPSSTDQGCNAGEHGTYSSVSWTNIVVTDTANGVTESYPDQTATT
jgi:hypothetical protein